MSIYNHEKHLQRLNEPLAYYTANPEAMAPRKADVTDAGVLLTLTNRTQNRIDDKSFEFNEFTTETILHAPPNHFIWLLPSDELLQKGYVMWPTVHQPRNFDTLIKVRLYKISDVEDLHLPLQGAIRALVSPACHCHLSPIKMSKDAGGDVSRQNLIRHGEKTQSIHDRVKTSQAGWFL